MSVAPSWSIALQASLSTTRVRRLLAMLGLGIGLVSVAALAGVLVFWFSHGAWPGDTYTYYLAGERLNRGHALYDLAVEDLWYADRAFPLYSPPLLAVIWRPLAALPGYIGVLVWWSAIAYAALVSVALVLVGTRGWAGLLVLPLSLPLGLLIGVGNVDALVLLGMLVAWRLATTGRLRSAGFLVGFLASLKLTPIVLIVWLVAERRWMAVRWAIASAAIWALIAILGTEPGIFVRYFQVVRDATAIVRPGGILLGALAVTVVLLLGRLGRPQVSFVFAVLAVPVASPLAALHVASLALGAVAPWVDWTVGQRAEPTVTTGGSIPST